MTYGFNLLTDIMIFLYNIVRSRRSLTILYINLGKIPEFAARRCRVVFLTTLCYDDHAIWSIGSTGGKWMKASIARTLALLVFASHTQFSCVTTEPIDESAGRSGVSDRVFVPTTFLSTIHKGETRYANLYAPDSFALWVSPEVADLKREQSVAEGMELDPDLDHAARYITDRYLVFECHLRSAFPDASIAYDVVGLRNIALYLETPEGHRIHPIQRIMDAHLEQDNEGALQVFERSNIVVFEKTDIITGAPAIDGEAARVRLVAEGFNSSFYFEWIATPPEPEPVFTEPAPKTRWSPTQTEAYRVAKVGFEELFTRLRRLGEYLE